METKTCTKCGETKPLDEFKKDSTKRTGYGSRCKKCFSDAYHLRLQDPEKLKKERERTRNRYRTKVATLPPRTSQASAIRIGHIYIIRCDRFFKIGRSIDAARRFKRLNALLPFEMELIHAIESDDVVRAERELHDRFSGTRTTGEWFELSPQEVNWLLGIQTIIFGK